MSLLLRVLGYLIMQIKQFDFSVFGHGRLRAVVLQHLRVLSVRGGEEHHCCGQRDQEDPEATEEEGEEGD